MSVRYEPARLRERMVSAPFPRLFRLIHRMHHATPLKAVPAPSRFSDPRGQYAVLYAAATVRCAFWEGLARNRFTHKKRREVPRCDVEARDIVSFRTAAPLDLIDLRMDGPIRIGAPTAVAHDANHAAGRALSAAVYRNVPEADGFWFHSRFVGDDCIAVFDRALSKLELLACHPLIQFRDFLDALDDYDITLTVPPRA